MKTASRTPVTFLIDPDLLCKLKGTFPGLNQTSKINIAIENFIRLVGEGKISADEVIQETERVIRRKYSKEKVEG